MGMWQVHAHIHTERAGRAAGEGLGSHQTRRTHAVPATVEDSTDVTEVEATSPLQARVRGLAVLRRHHPGATVRITSVHPLGDDEEDESEEE